MVTKTIKDLFKKKMVLEKDFDLDPEQNDPSGVKMAAMKILTGKYAGVSFRFGKIQVADKENPDGTYTVNFDYDIVNPAKHKEEKLRDSKRFTDTLGSILNTIIIAGIERELETHEEVRDDYSEESNTKRRVRKKGTSVSK